MEGIRFGRNLAPVGQWKETTFKLGTNGMNLHHV